MKLFARKESWSRFSAKAGVFLALLGLVALFFSRYTIAYDPQDVRCLPDHSVYLIDKKDRRMVRDGLYAFEGKGLTPLFEDGQQMIKRLKGLPGDNVEIDTLESIIINTHVVTRGLSLLEKLDKPIASFVGKGQLGQGNYWFMGETDDSFDSRYWGTVTDEQIIGRAYPLF